jgi:hypothetical protein
VLVFLAAVGALALTVFAVRALAPSVTTTPLVGGEWYVLTFKVPLELNADASVRSALPQLGFPAVAKVSKGPEGNVTVVKVAGPCSGLGAPEIHDTPNLTVEHVNAPSPPPAVAPY